MSPETPRRSLVAIVAVLSLLGAVAVVRGATAWTGSNASLAAKPADPQALAAQLRDEQSRSDGLRAQLDQVSTQALQLADALKAAQDKATTDASTAAQLAAKLKAAEQKLVALQAQLGTPGTVTQVVTQTAASTAAGTPTGDDGGEPDD
jgi:chromosome segregation ATPase